MTEVLSVPTSEKSRWPEAGSTEEAERFAVLQRVLSRQFEQIFPDPLLPRTVVVLPSLSLHTDELRKISGVHHYEERLLFALMLLRMPRTKLIFVTSQPIAPGIIDYYLHLLPGVPTVHARERLLLMSCHDSSEIPLTRKVLNRPRLINRIQDAIDDLGSAHITCFNATHLERTLAVRLGIPLYACDPSLNDLGTKSGSREVFRQAGIAMPDGFERLSDMHEVADALAELRIRNPGLKRAVVKLEEGFSGEGNAVFRFAGMPGTTSVNELRQWVAGALPRQLRFEAKTETWEHYASSFAEMGGIVESFVEGTMKASPSVQCRVNPAGVPKVISTHDQVLGGPSGQVFMGCTFPADAVYRRDIQEAGMKAADELAKRGVLGRFGVDFVSVREGSEWSHYAIEINLRKGGTTHPFLMLDFLTDGRFNANTGEYVSPTGQPRYYYASDNLVSERYRGLTPKDLIDIAVDHRLHFHGGSQEGVVFHLIGALSEFGKLGVLCIGDSPGRAHELYDKIVSVLDLETNGGRPE